MNIRLIWLALAGAALAAHAAARHRGLPEFHSLASVCPKVVLPDGNHVRHERKTRMRAFDRIKLPTRTSGRCMCSTDS